MGVESVGITGIGVAGGTLGAGKGTEGVGLGATRVAAGIGGLVALNGTYFRKCWRLRRVTRPDPSTRTAY